MQVQLNYIGKWVTIPLCDLKNLELNSFVHPNDLNKLQDLSQPVVYVIAEQKEYLNLQITEEIEIRIKPAIVQVSIKPDFFIDDLVKTTDSKGNTVFGVINDLYWHLKHNKYIYVLRIKEKIKSRQYFVEDLQKIQTD